MEDLECRGAFLLLWLLEFYDRFLGVYPVEEGEILLGDLEQALMSAMQEETRPATGHFRDGCFSGVKRSDGFYRRVTRFDAAIFLSLILTIHYYKQKPSMLTYLSPSSTPFLSRLLHCSYLHGLN